MKLNVEDLPHGLSGWVIEDIKVDEHGQIAPEDIGKSAPLTLPAWDNPDKQALLVFDSWENAAGYRNAVPLALLEGHRWFYSYLDREVLSGCLLCTEAIVEVVINPHLYPPPGLRATAEAVFASAYEAGIAESISLDAGPAKGEHA